jgi:hypothetical protein
MNNSELKMHDSSFKDKVRKIISKQTVSVLKPKREPPQPAIIKVIYKDEQKDIDFYKREMSHADSGDLQSHISAAKNDIDRQFS